jgi:hypothetical protein
MTTSRTVYSGRVTKSLVSTGAFKEHPMVLADVGVSGGIADYWRQFEPNLQVFGFDPLVTECKRSLPRKRTRT